MNNNKPQTIQRNITDPFCAFPKTISDNPSLSWAAKGILCYLLAENSGSKVRVSDLIKRRKSEENTARKALEELIAAGLVEVDYDGIDHCISLTKPAK
jgi:DNA-binding MarR family transcriptional regulator